MGAGDRLQARFGRSKHPVKLESTLALEPQRAVGGVLEAGDLVGVVLSFDPFEITDGGEPAAGDEEIGDGEEDGTGDDADGPSKTPNMTHLTLHKVQVTSVRYAQRDSERIVERPGGHVVELSGDQGFASWISFQIRIGDSGMFM